MELMNLLCWMLVLPAVGLVTVQHVLDGGVSMKWMHKYVHGLSDAVFTHCAIHYRWMFKTRIGHSALHGAVAVCAALAAMTK